MSSCVRLVFNTSLVCKVYVSRGRERRAERESERPLSAVEASLFHFLLNRTWNDGRRTKIYVRMFIRSFIYTYTHIHTHIYIYTYIHTYTYKTLNEIYSRCYGKILKLQKNQPNVERVHYYKSCFEFFVLK